MARSFIVFKIVKLLIQSPHFSQACMNNLGIMNEVSQLRPKVSPPLSQEIVEEIINPRIFVVVSPNKSAVGPRLQDIHDEAIRELGNKKDASHLEVPELYYDKDCRLYYTYPREAADQILMGK